jgi:hypothetical protein
VSLKGMKSCVQATSIFLTLYDPLEFDTLDITHCHPRQAI